MLVVMKANIFIRNGWTNRTTISEQGLKYLYITKYELEKKCRHTDGQTVSQRPDDYSSREHSWKILAVYVL